MNLYTFFSICCVTKADESDVFFLFSFFYSLYHLFYGNFSFFCEPTVRFCGISCSIAWLSSLQELFY